MICATFLPSSGSSIPRELLSTTDRNALEPMWRLRLVQHVQHRLRPYPPHRAIRCDLPLSPVHLTELSVESLCLSRQRTPPSSCGLSTMSCPSLVRGEDMPLRANAFLTKRYGVWGLHPSTSQWPPLDVELPTTYIWSLAYIAIVQSCVEV